MTNAAPAFKTRTFSALRSLANKEPRGGLIDGVPLLPQSGVVLIVGDPLSGKSSFCTFVAVAMALGDSLGGACRRALRSAGF